MYYSLFEHCRAGWAAHLNGAGTPPLPGDADCGEASAAAAEAEARRAATCSDASPYLQVPALAHGAPVLRR